MSIPHDGEHGQAGRREEWMVSSFLPRDKMDTKLRYVGCQPCKRCRLLLGGKDEVLAECQQQRKFRLCR